MRNNKPYNVGCFALPRCNVKQRRQQWSMRRLPVRKAFMGTVGPLGFSFLKLSTFRSHVSFPHAVRCRAPSSHSTGTWVEREWSSAGETTSAGTARIWLLQNVISSCWPCYSLPCCMAHGTCCACPCRIPPSRRLKVPQQRRSLQQLAVRRRQDCWVTAGCRWVQCSQSCQTGRRSSLGKPLALVVNWCVRTGTHNWAHSAALRIR